MRAESRVKVMHFFLILILSFIALPFHSLALPNPDSQSTHPHIEGEPLIPDLTQKNYPPSRSDNEHFESMSAQTMYDLEDCVVALKSMLEQYITAQRDIYDRIGGRGNRLEAAERRGSQLVKQGAEQSVEQSAEQSVEQSLEVLPSEVMDTEIEEDDWEGNFTRPEGPRPPPKSAPF